MDEDRGDVAPRYVHLRRDSGLTVEHYTQLFAPGRYGPGFDGHPHVGVPSTYVVNYQGGQEAPPGPMRAV